MRKLILAFISVFFLGLLIGYIPTLASPGPAKPNPGHSWNEIECDTNMCVDTTNQRVGIGTTDLWPNAKLFVDRPLGVYGGGATTIYIRRMGDDNLANGGTGWGVAQSDVAIRGTSARGNQYSAGVAGYNRPQPRTAGVIGADWNAEYWGALGYKDENGNAWGVYTPNNAYVGNNLTVRGELKAKTPALQKKEEKSGTVTVSGNTDYQFKVFSLEPNTWNNVWCRVGLKGGDKIQYNTIEFFMYDNTISETVSWFIFPIADWIYVDGYSIGPTLTAPIGSGGGRMDIIIRNRDSQNQEYYWWCGRLALPIP
jgi:hypothetical protein